MCLVKEQHLDFILLTRQKKRCVLLKVFYKFDQNCRNVAIYYFCTDFTEEQNEGKTIYMVILNCIFYTIFILGVHFSCMMHVSD